MALCLVCGRWLYWKLGPHELQRVDDLHCPICGGSCEPDTDTSAFEIEELTITQRAGGTTC